ncbi:FliH/SctL family protein [Arthrobacter halodurans]|uniref:FliH/SctL family protein n=1 Tax=Arthrobacter halodurans TaxID=516699 RepID=A0ABV4UNX4_9MICC
MSPSRTLSAGHGYGLADAAGAGPAAATSFEPAVFAAVGAPADHDGAAAAGRVRGYAAGYAAGLRAAEERTRALREELAARHELAERARNRTAAEALAALNGAAAALERRTVPVVHDVRHTLVETALELAEAVLGTELSDAEHGARAALARALEGVEPRTVHAVRLHPADLAALPQDMVRAAEVRLVPDAGLTRGDAVTDFPDGFLDARISTALARCREALAGGTE